MNGLRDRETIQSIQCILDKREQEEEKEKKNEDCSMYVSNQKKKKGPDPHPSMFSE